MHECQGEQSGREQESSVVSGGDKACDLKCDESKQQDQEYEAELVSCAIQIDPGAADGCRAGSLIVVTTADGGPGLVGSRQLMVQMPRISGQLGSRRAGLVDRRRALGTGMRRVAVQRLRCGITALCSAAALRYCAACKLGKLASVLPPLV